jgi:hypothetical protein
MPRLINNASVTNLARGIIMFASMFIEAHTPNTVVEWSALLLRIREVPGSNLSQEIRLS